MRPPHLHLTAHLAGSRRLSGRNSLGAIVPLLVVAAHLVLFAYLAQWRAPTPPAASVGIPIAGLFGVGHSLSPPSAKPQPKATPTPVAKAIAEPDAPEPAAPPIDRLIADTLASPAFDLKPPLALAPILDAEPITLSKPGGVVSAPAAPSVEASANSALAGGRSCDLFDRIQATLQASEAVRAAVGAIPRQARSVANAVMIWDARWVDPAALGGPHALDPIRQAVMDRIVEASGACQADPVRGPRLVMIGDQHDHTILAFGSGEWRWEDLLRADLTR